MSINKAPLSFSARSRDGAVPRNRFRISSPREDSVSSEDEEQGDDEQVRTPLYPGGGLVEAKMVRTPNESGDMTTPSGAVPKLTGVFLSEFAATFFFFFCITMAIVSVQSSTIMIHNGGVTTLGTISTDNITGVNTTHVTLLPASYQFINGATGLIDSKDSTTVIANSLATPLTALFAAVLFYVVLRAAPGVAFNPLVSIHHFFFQYCTEPIRDKETGKILVEVGDPLPMPHWIQTGKETIVAILAQFLAGFLAILSVWLLQHRNYDLLADTKPSSKLSSDAEIIGYEALASFFFMFAINIYSNPPRICTARDQALFLSLVLGLIVLFFDGFTGAGLNFVRTFSVALVRTMSGTNSFSLATLYYFIGQSIGYFVACVVTRMYTVEMRHLVKKVGATQYSELDSIDQAKDEKKKRKADE